VRYFSESQAADFHCATPHHTPGLTGLRESHLLHELILCGAERAPLANALTHGGASLSYQQRMPAYMVPAGAEPAAGPLPCNPNGKIDRKLLATSWHERRESVHAA
jgi:hypothetical protein